MDKKYPKDTPVTLEMLLEIANSGATHERIKSFIEPPNPQPKEGEWWMCRYRHGDVIHDVVLLMRDMGWRNRNTAESTYASDENITPLYKMVPEKEGE